MPHIKKKKKTQQTKTKNKKQPNKTLKKPQNKQKNPTQTASTKTAMATTIKQTKIQNTKRNKNGSCFRVILTLNISIPTLLPFVSTEQFFWLHRCDFLHCYDVLFKYLLPKFALWSNYCYSDHYIHLRVLILALYEHWYSFWKTLKSWNLYMLQYLYSGLNTQSRQGFMWVLQLKSARHTKLQGRWGWKEIVPAHTGPLGGGCPVLCPDGFWISLKMENHLQTYWATCANTQKLLR